MRRRSGTLLPIEVSILAQGLAMGSEGNREFHGYRLAKRMQEADEARRLTAHGTLYKALARMEQRGLLDSRWEDPEEAAVEQRPIRRLYHVTGAGEVALAQARKTPELRVHRSRGAWAPS